jgi:hypothetical protein
VWNQGFVRFLAINKLDYVIEESFILTNLNIGQQDDNKLVYYILEDAVSGSAVATKYLRRAAVWNGHEAYFLLFDGFALSGPATAAIFLGELSHFRFKVDETPSEVVLRLQELFDDLESIPGNAAMVIHGTQKINYLLSAMRHERSLASVYAQIQTEQVRGTITFEQACDDLHYRCEAMRADDLLALANQPAKVRGLVSSTSELPETGSRALITTADKRQNRGAPKTDALVTFDKNQNKVSKKKDTVVCMVKGCDTLTLAYLRLCKRCYHECIAGKNSTLILKSGDKAVFDVATQWIAFPPSADRGSATSGPRSIVKAAVTFVPETSE